MNCVYQHKYLLSNGHFSIYHKLIDVHAGPWSYGPSGKTRLNKWPICPWISLIYTCETSCLQAALQPLMHFVRPAKAHQKYEGFINLSVASRGNWVQFSQKYGKKRYHQHTNCWLHCLLTIYAFHRYVLKRSATRDSRATCGSFDEYILWLFDESHCI